MRCAHVAERTVQPSVEYDSAGSREPTKEAGNAIRKVPPFRASVLAGPRPAAAASDAAARTSTTAAT
jgi:hypothetical protein